MLSEPRSQFENATEVLDLVPEFDSAHFDMFAKTKPNGFVDEIIFIHRGSGTQYPVSRDLISLAFGQPMMTTFERIFGHDGSRLRIPERPRATHPDDKREILQPIHQMSFRAQDDTTWKVIKTQDIIDRIIQYSIEEELKMQDALEEILLAQMDNDSVDDALSLSEDDIILSTGEKFSDFASRVGDDVRIELVEDATDDEIRAGLAQAETNRREIEERAKAKPHDARGLQGLLKESFLVSKNQTGSGLLSRLLSSSSDAAQHVLERARSLSPKQARLIEAVLMASVLTAQFSQTSDIEIKPDRVEVINLADTNASTTVTTGATATENSDEVQRCIQSITPEQKIDMRVDLFKESQFYQDRIHSPIYSERARVIWVQIVADAVKEAWTKDANYFKANGYRDADHLFTTQVYKAYAESHGNQFKFNRSNPMVAGLYHDSVKTARSVIAQQNLREKYPDVFSERRLQRDDLINARRSTIVDIYISAGDFRYLSNKFNAEINSVFPQYNPYIVHVNGGPKAHALIEAAINHPTKLNRATGGRVLKTAVDIVGRGVANDNPSLYYRTVKIYRGQEVTTAFIATLPEEAVKKVRTQRRARSVDESVNILIQRGQNQSGIESIGHPSVGAVRASMVETCRLAA